MSDADIRALREEIDRLQRRVDELSDQAPARIDAAPVADPAAMPRRGMLRTVGTAAAGVAVGSLAFAKSAGAADGAFIVIGSNTNTADTPTSLVNTAGYSATPQIGMFHVSDDLSKVNINLAASCISAVATGDPFLVAVSGASSSVGAKFDGPVPLKLTDSTGSAAPTTASGTLGQFKVVNGDLWFCSRSAPSTIWRRLSGVSVAGGFVAINPARAYDSRQGAYTVSGLMTSNTNRIISIKDAHDAAGGVTTPNVVPAGATAVTFNVTVTGTTGPNFLAVSPSGASTFTASTLNWTTADASVANASVCLLGGDRELKVFVGDQPGSTHVIVDITGYYL